MQFPKKKKHMAQRKELIAFRTFVRWIKKCRRNTITNTWEEGPPVLQKLQVLRRGKWRTATGPWRQTQAHIPQQAVCITEGPEDSVALASLVSMANTFSAEK